VLDGRFDIELDGHDTVNLHPYEGFCVPAGLSHRPVAPQRAVVLMFERAGIRPEGDLTASGCARPHAGSRFPRRWSPR
jgi:hypothetical protein